MMMVVLGLRRGSRVVSRDLAAARISAKMSASHARTARLSSLIVAGIESTCDDTGVGIVDAASERILVDSLASQFHLHAEYAGIVPHFAARAHATHLPKVWNKAIHELQAQGHQNIDALGLAVGPGLAPCLSAGLAFTKQQLFQHHTASNHELTTQYEKITHTAKQLGVKYFVPVNHLEAHLLVSRLLFGRSSLPLPFLVLLASGGHTMLITARSGHISQPMGVHVPLGGHSEGDAVAREWAGMHEMIGAAPLVQVLPATATAAAATTTTTLTVPIYEKLGNTLDDSMGECFDKVARLLRVWEHTGSPLATAQPDNQDLPRAELAQIHDLKSSKDFIKFRKFDDDEEDGPPPGTGHLGAALEALALEGDPIALRLPIPLRGSNSPNGISCAFSFSGLKSAVRRHLERAPETVKSREAVANVAAAFHVAVLSHVGDQLARALSYCTFEASLGRLEPIRQVVVCGGVAANSLLRGAVTDVASHFGVQPLFPSTRLCTDNGVMIAWAAAEKLLAVRSLLASRGIEPDDAALRHYVNGEGRHLGILCTDSADFPERLAQVDIRPRDRF